MYVSLYLYLFILFKEVLILVDTNLKNEKLCGKEILCFKCPFKLDFHGKEQNPCYKGFFRKNKHNHKRNKNRVFMRY